MHSLEDWGFLHRYWLKYLKSLIERISTVISELLHFFWAEVINNTVFRKQFTVYPK